MCLIYHLHLQDLKSLGNDVLGDVPNKTRSRRSALFRMYEHGVEPAVLRQPFVSEHQPADSISALDKSSIACFKSEGPSSVSELEMMSQDRSFEH